MKVVYEKSMVDKILDAKADADRQNKEIEEIILSPGEWDQLTNELLHMVRGCSSIMQEERNRVRDGMKQNWGMVYGVVIRRQSN